MSIVALLVAVIAAAAALGLAGWFWLAVAAASEEMRAFVAVDGLRLEG